MRFGLLLRSQGCPLLSLQIQIVKNLFFKSLVKGRDVIVVIPKEGQMAGNFPVLGLAARSLHAGGQAIQRPPVQKCVEGLVDTFLDQNTFFG